jgi:hypothetical protein
MGELGMKRVWLLLAILALCLVQCLTDQNMGFVILQNALPTAKEASGRCTVPQDASTVPLNEGVLDVSGKVSYFVYPVAQSLLESKMSEPGVEQRRMIIRKALVDLEIPPEVGTFPPNLVSFQVPLYGTLDPQKTIGLEVEAISKTLAAQLAGRIKAGQDRWMWIKVRVVGEIPEHTVTSSPMRFPVRLCKGCLIKSVGTCPMPSTTICKAGAACNPGQDFQVDCCDQANGTLVCPCELAPAS